MASKEKPARAARGKSWLIPVLASVLAAAVAGGGAAFFLVRKGEPAKGGEHAEATADEHGEGGEGEGGNKGPSSYVPIDPAFVVNLADPDDVRYLQVEIQVLTHDPKVADQIKTHMPMIRNRLLLLFSQQTSTELRTREDKERLQDAALKEVQAVLTEQTGKPGIDALLFTSFVTQ